MEPSDTLSPAQFLQQQLQEVTTLLEKQQLEASLVQRGPAANHELVEAMLQKQHKLRLQDKFAELHPADIAFILESLPLDKRQLAWDAIGRDMDGQVLLEVSDAVRETLISSMEEEELATVAITLETDEIADLAADLPKRTMVNLALAQ